MKARHYVQVVLGLVCVTVIGAAPDQGALDQYRAFVDAVRAGNRKDVLKLVETVPDGTKPLLAAKVDQLIAVEALKAEMIAQFAAANVAEAAGQIGGIPTADVLKTLRARSRNERIVGLLATDPVSKSEGMVGWMVKSGDEWKVPAGMLLDLPPAEAFVEPDEGQRAQIQQYSQAIAKAAKAVLGRLKAKEFKSAGEVATAFGEEVQRASER